MLTIKQVAERLGCSRTNVYSLIAAGLLVPVRVGLKKGFRFSEEQLAEFLAGRAGDPPAPVVAGTRRLKHLRV